MQLFDSVKMYVFVFCVLALIAVPNLHQLKQNHESFVHMTFTRARPAKTKSFTVLDLSIRMSGSRMVADIWKLLSLWTNARWQALSG